MAATPWPDPTAAGRGPPTPRARRRRRRRCRGRPCGWRRCACTEVWVRGWKRGTQQMPAPHSRCRLPSASQCLLQAENPTRILPAPPGLPLHSVTKPGSSAPAASAAAPTAPAKGRGLHCHCRCQCATMPAGGPWHAAGGTARGTEGASRSLRPRLQGKRSLQAEDESGAVPRCLLQRAATWKASLRRASSIPSLVGLSVALCIARSAGSSAGSAGVTLSRTSGGSGSASSSLAWASCDVKVKGSRAEGQGGGWMGCRAYAGPAGQPARQCHGHSFKRPPNASTAPCRGGPPTA